MDVELLIAGVAVAWGLVWLVLGIADHRRDSCPPPRIGQPARHAPPPLPSPARAEMSRPRPARVSRGRHARPEAPQ
jgi:hypothetical protein